MNGPLIDEAALETQTFGDAELKHEILQMFLQQAPALLPRLRHP